MENWERKLTNYKKDGKLDKKIQELESRFDNSNREIKENGSDSYQNADQAKKSREDYNELLKLKRVRENLPKVEHLKEFKKVLNKSLKELEKELNDRKQKSKTNEQLRKNIEKLEKDLLNSEKELEELDNIRNGLVKEQAEIEAQLSNENLDDETRRSLTERKDSVLKDIFANDEKYSSKLNEKNQLENNIGIAEDNSKKEVEKQERKINKFTGKSNESIRSEIVELNAKLSMLNIAADNLIEGKSWQEVEINLTKDEKFTGKRKITEEVKNNDKENGDNGGIDKTNDGTEYYETEDIDDRTVDEDIEYADGDDPDRADDESVEYTDVDNPYRVDDEDVEYTDVDDPYRADDEGIEYGEDGDDIDRTDDEGFGFEDDNDPDRTADEELENDETKKQSIFTRILNKVKEFFRNLRDSFSTKRLSERQYAEPNMKVFGEDYKDLNDELKGVRSENDINYDDIINNYMGEPEDKDNQPVVVEVANEKPETNERNEFLTQLREIADKGLDGIENEKKAEKTKTAKEKLNEMRKANREEEAKKYGEAYAKQSDYRDKDDEGR